jgi:hypothetical protein
MESLDYSLSISKIFYGCSNIHQMGEEYLGHAMKLNTKTNRVIGLQPENKHNLTL